MTACESERNSASGGVVLSKLLSSISLVEVEADFRFPVGRRGRATAMSKHDCLLRMRSRQAREVARDCSSDGAGL